MNKKAFIAYYKRTKTGKRSYLNKSGNFNGEDILNKQLATDPALVSLFPGVSSFFDITNPKGIQDLLDWANAHKTLFGVNSDGTPDICTVLRKYKEFLSTSSSSSTLASTEEAVTIELNSTPLNLILYGPPGTGKTYHAIDKALEILGYEGPDDRAEKLKAFKSYRDKDRIVFTTFHQSMSYEDFIEGIKPTLDKTPVGYIIEDGLFKQISDKASNDMVNNYVLIIDEINRGNIANIFGELITLIEDSKRAGEKEAISVKLPYSKETFSVPNNLYIIGTMNTADRSVEALDSALRRRFVFEEMMPCPDLLKDVNVKNLDISLKDLLETINGRIEILKDREHQIGHSYFMGFVKVEACEIEAKELLPVFKNNIIPLLQEYFYGDYEKILLVLGECFIERKTASVKFAGNQSYEDVPENIYSIRNVIETEAEDAIKKLMNK